VAAGPQAKQDSAASRCEQLDQTKNTRPKSVTPMKSIIFSQYGSPEVLKLGEVARPDPKADEVLVKIHASSINSWDMDLLRGEFTNRLIFGLRKPKIKTLGADVAGQVEAVGADVTRFSIGQAVWGDLSHCGWGGFAEYVCAREDALALKPTNMTFEGAAAVPQAGLLALQGLDVGNLRRGQKVLINGAGGGVGLFAVQIAKSLGAEVTGVDRTEKWKTLRSIGADHVIDFTRDDFTQGGSHYDLILDAITNRSIFDYLRVLKPNGTYVTVAGSLNRLFQIFILGRWIKTASKKLMRVLAYKPNKGLNELKDLIESGKVVSVIDGPYMLEEIQHAFRHFAEGTHQGKIVISIA
jgi:NADPH:quinone reductase-like Zn-dependent oxidoreductase